MRGWANGVLCVALVIVFVWWLYPLLLYTELLLIIRTSEANEPAMPISYLSLSLSLFSEHHLRNRTTRTISTNSKPPSLQITARHIPHLTKRHPFQES